jgi:hypothetical protein
LLVIDGFLGKVNDLALNVPMVPDPLARGMWRPAMRVPTHGVAVIPAMAVATVDAPVGPGALVMLKLTMIPMARAPVHLPVRAMVALELTAFPDLPALFHPMARALVLVDSLGLLERPVAASLVAGIGLGQAGDGQG